MVPLNSTIVTGGAGFIGTHLVRELLKSQRVLVVDKKTRPREFPRSRNLTYEKNDVRNIDKIFTEKLRRSNIVHLAAETSVEKSVQYPLSTVRTNIETTVAALELARRLDSPRFVFASTAAVYGDRRGACKETDPAAPASPYAASKLASEYYCKIYSKLYEIPTVILRYFNVYGPGQSNNYAGVITHFVRNGLEGRPPVIFGDGEQTRDFVYVGDVVTATTASLHRDLPGGIIINIGTGQPMTIKSLAERTIHLLHLERLRPVFGAPRRGDVRYSSASIELSRAKLRFRPSWSLDEGLSEFVQWARAST